MWILHVSGMTRAVYMCMRLTVNDVFKRFPKETRLTAN